MFYLVSKDGPSWHRPPAEEFEKRTWTRLFNHLPNFVGLCRVTRAVCLHPALQAAVAKGKSSANTEQEELVGDSPVVSETELPLHPDEGTAAAQVRGSPLARWHLMTASLPLDLNGVSQQGRAGGVHARDLPAASCPPRTSGVPRRQLRFGHILGKGRKVRAKRSRTARSNRTDRVRRVAKVSSASCQSGQNGASRTDSSDTYDG